MVFLLISIFYLLLGIVKTRYTVTSQLRNDLMEKFNESKILYDRITKLCNSSEIDYVKEYDSQSYGEATDSLENIANKEICYYYDTDNTQPAQTNSNVLFGGFCWQIIRTTGTGGVKLMYNGKADNNRCLTTRMGGTSVEFTGSIYSLSTSLQSTYKFGKSYFYDEETKMFTLDEIIDDTWSLNNNDNFVGSYTCKSSSITCSTIYYVGKNRKVGDRIYAISYKVINSSTIFNSVGKTPYNPDNDSPAMVGYMFNTSYDYINKQMKTWETVLHIQSISNTYTYADNVIWNAENGEYVLIDEKGLTDEEKANNDFSSFVGKYTFLSSTSGSGVNYIFGVSGNTAYCMTLERGNTVDSITGKYTFGTGIDNDGNLINPITISRREWYDSFSKDEIKNRKYMCLGDEIKCENVRYIDGIDGRSYYYVDVKSEDYRYANSIIYDSTSNSYRLDNSKEIVHGIWPFIYNNINNTRYTCFKNDTDECGDSVNYIYKTTGSRSYYITLKNGDTIEKALHKMLNYKFNTNIGDENINVYNSAAKGIVDNWFKNNFTEYIDYLDDGVFCNNRVVYGINGWDPKTQTNDDNIVFNYRYPSTDDGKIANKSFACPNITDRFSLSNNLAKLKYSVGMITFSESNYFSRYYGNINSEKNYWTMTPSDFHNEYAHNNKVQGKNDYTPWDVYYNYNIRPVIVLKPGIEATGKGTYDEPYIIEIRN